MKKPSLSLIVFTLVSFFTTLLISFDSIAQRRSIPPHQPTAQHRDGPFSSSDDMVIKERVMDNLRSHITHRLTDFLRPTRLQAHFEVETLLLEVQPQRSGRGRGHGHDQGRGRGHGREPSMTRLEILHQGRQIAFKMIGSNQSLVEINLPSRVKLLDLELSVSDDIFVETMIVKLNKGSSRSSFPRRLQQVAPNELIVLDLNHQVRGFSKLPLDQIIENQLGLSLTGAQIERVVVHGERSSVEVLLNNRKVSESKVISSRFKPTPLVIQSFESVRSLDLVIQGYAFIDKVLIRVGNVHPVRF